MSQKVDNFSVSYLNDLASWDHILYTVSTSPGLEAPPAEASWIVPDASLGDDEHDMRQFSSGMLMSPQHDQGASLIHSCATSVSIPVLLDMYDGSVLQVSKEGSPASPHTHHDNDNCSIAGPTIVSGVEGEAWGKRRHELMLDDEEPNHSVVTAAVSPIGSTGPTTADDSQETLVTFLHEALQELWAVDHPEPDFDTEREKSRVIPCILAESLSYAQYLIDTREAIKRGGGGGGGGGVAAGRECGAAPLLPLVSRYSPPMFTASSFANEANRLTKWLSTWQQHHDNGEGDRATHVRASQHQPPSQARAGITTIVTDEAKQESSVSSETEPDDGAASHTILDSVAYYYDERGRRLSARIARQEALQRQREEAAERERQKQKGYFSNDTSKFGSVSADGGEGAFSNIAVLRGPCGIGKTAAAYSAAQVMGFRIVEINTSMRRTHANIKKSFTEATQCKQIKLQLGSNGVGRQELERYRLEAEAKRKREAELAEEQRIQRERAAEEARQREKRAAEAQQAQQKLEQKKAAGVRKVNAISQSAIVNFFRPKVKPPEGAEVVDVDQQVVVDVDEEAIAARKRKRESTAASSVDEVFVVTDEEVAQASNTNNKVSAPKPAAVMQLPLILVESADIVMDDESQRHFFSAIKTMASESKFPIIVTANEVWSTHQIQAFFGSSTPYATMEAPTRMYVVLQLFLVAAVEAGLLALLHESPHESSKIASLPSASEGKKRKRRDGATSVTPLVVNNDSRMVVLVECDDRESRRKRLVAMRTLVEQVADASATSMRLVDGRLSQRHDMRRALNQLQLELGIVTSPVSPLATSILRPGGSLTWMRDASLAAVCDSVASTLCWRYQQYSMHKYCMTADDDNGGISDGAGGTRDDLSDDDTGDKKPKPLRPTSGSSVAASNDDCTTTLLALVKDMRTTEGELLARCGEEQGMRCKALSQLISQCYRTRNQMAKFYGARSSIDVFEVLCMSAKFNQIKGKR